MVSVIVGIVVGIIICIAIVLGFMNVETPAKARARLLDSRTENALSNLVMSISSNYSLDKKIEGNINLAEWINPSKEISIEFITYRKVSDKEFELCAEFGTESLIGRPISVDDMPWAGHKSGKECYTFDAEKELAKYSKNSYTDPEQMLQDKINASQNPPVASPGLEPATAPVK